MASRAQPLELIPGLALRVSSLKPAGRAEYWDVTTIQTLTEITECKCLDLGNVHLLLQTFIYTFNWEPNSGKFRTHTFIFNMIVESVTFGGLQFHHKAFCPHILQNLPPLKTLSLSLWWRWCGLKALILLLEASAVDV